MVDPGGLIFVGWDSDNNDVAFVTTAPLEGGEVIYFTDSEWDGTAFNPGEQLFEWTVPAEGIASGELLTIDMSAGPGSAVIVEGGALDGATSGSVDYIQGGGILASGNEMLWAFQGDRVDDEVTPTNFISVIGNEDNDNANQSPNLDNTGLTQQNGAIIIDGDHDYMVFEGFDALPDPLSAEGVIAAISDLSNWTVAGPGRNFENNNPLPDNGFTNVDPVRAFDPEDVTTLFFSGDQVAFFDDISSSDGDVSTDISVSEQPFLASDVVEIDILNDSLRPDGEFDFDEVIFTRVSVTRDGETYDFRVNDGSKIKESGATDSESGQAIEQGDTFFTTNDEVNSLIRAPLSGPFAAVPQGKMVFATNATFVDGGVTNIVREQTITDEGGMEVGDVNANFFFGEVLTPIPCFAQGTRIVTLRGAVRVEDLVPDDMILTRDNGYQPVRWIGAKRCVAVGALQPIRIRPGFFCNERDLLLSPQHRVLVQGWQAELLFGEDEMLVPVKHLCNGDTVAPAEDVSFVTYYHILLDRHEVIFAEGVSAETLDYSYLSSLPKGHPSRSEIDSLFPDLLQRDVLPGTARPALKSHEAYLLHELEA